MRRRSRRREVYIRRQVALLCFIAGIVIALVWLVQATYEIIPVGQKVLAIQDEVDDSAQDTEYDAVSENTEASPDSPHSLAIWQGSKGRPIAVEEQAVLASQQQSTSAKSYTGIGKILYCLYMTQQLSPELSADDINDQCQLERVVQAEESDNHEGTDQDPASGTKPGDAGTKPNDTGNIESNYAGQVYLTFDDGPSKITPAVLDLLAEANIKATFFVLGEMVEKHTQLAQRIVTEGHSIGNHSYNHRYNELYTSANSFVEQVLNTSNAIYDATGLVTPLFRAPGGTYGNLDASYMKALDDAGYLVYDWNVDSGDSTSRDITVDEIISNIKGAKLKERMMILMHDSATHQATLDALPQIIAYFQALNYEFVVIDAETEPITSPIATSIKWKRTAMNDKQAQKLKTQTGLLFAQAEEQKADQQQSKGQQQKEPINVPESDHSVKLANHD